MSAFKRIYRIFTLISGQVHVFLKFGVKGNVDDILNFYQLWSLPPIVNEKFVIRSSISDVSSYNRICTYAVNDEKAFRKFKSNREYRQILEHVTREQGLNYLDCLTKDKWLMNHFNALTEPSEGKPFRYSYAKFKRLSPTDFRYAKVVADLFALFGSLDGFTVAEIGVGYGGQSVAIQKVFKPRTYMIFDLPSAIQLSLKYIERAGYTAVSPLLNNATKVKSGVDLLLSNYAFSELQGSVQEEYFDSVISTAKRGYVIYNHISPSDFLSMTAKEFAARIPGSEIFKEVPLTSPENVLVVWGHNEGKLDGRFEVV